MVKSLFSTDSPYPLGKFDEATMLIGVTLLVLAVLWFMATLIGTAAAMLIYETTHSLIQFGAILLGTLLYDIYEKCRKRTSKN